MEKIRIFLGGIGVGPGYSDTELHTAYGSLIQSQDQEDLLCQEMSLEEFNSIYNEGKVSFNLIQETVTFESYTALKRGIRTLARKFSDALGTGEITLVSHTQPEELKPRKNKLFAYVAVQYNFSDGQSVKILFHSPGGEARSFDKEDELVSYAHTLNGRDVTHLFAEREGVTVQKFAKRMMQILEKNHDKFVAKQAKNAEMKADLEAQTKASEDLDLQLSSVQNDLQLKKVENDGLAAAIAELDTKIEATETSCKNLRAKIATAKAEQEARLQDKTDEAESAVGPITPDFGKLASMMTDIDTEQFAKMTGTQNRVDNESIKEAWRDWVEQQLMAGKKFKSSQEAWKGWQDSLPEDDGTGDDAPGSDEDTGTEPDMSASGDFANAEAYIESMTDANLKKFAKAYFGYLSGKNKFPSLPKNISEDAIEQIQDKIAELSGLQPGDQPEESTSIAVEIANSILAGDYDGDPAKLEAKIEEIIDYLDENDPALLERVLQHNTDLLASIAA